ncbi:sensor histidine kinase [Dyadobacter fanqingshengii]|uniref:histidine kinase n=1 Tax=Dyadobacter fanqingshengii TaxID=2906443 RepID=A0A9X1TAH8_9BACT|nr:HAMP domain-containing sensor histidine kinase [Dyadobacter fanqingshengii]MCF0042575.1 HAMP domain-containing histidine kinase [Dyadobacter fanqingshengii]USJ36198.1 HAMP domain-containing histidine kinase [Dyadobacter fanqingshengii]
MNHFLHRAGFIVAASIPLFVLPARISEGQWKDPVNLIGSEIVIFMMSLTCWYAIHLIQQQYRRWPGLLLSVLCCCILSNVFYFTFNPIFKDFPFRTAQNPIGIKLLMLSSRGVLISIILIPAAYFLKRDRDARSQRKENERLAIERVKIENRLLDQAVTERTQALRQTLSTLEVSQEILEHQLYIQSRLVASITHDIRGPFKYLLIISEEICRLAQKQEYEQIGSYTMELNKSLETMYGFVNNILEFTKLPVHQKLDRSQRINLAQIVKDKLKLFDGIISTNSNQVHLDIDPLIFVTSNPSFLGIVIHNLLDNANKNGRNGLIKIGASADQLVTLLTIENAGSIAREIVEWVNLKSGHTYPPVGTTETQGIGLILVREITSLLEVNFQMESSNNKTKVLLTFSGHNTDSQQDATEIRPI